MEQISKGLFGARDSYTNNISMFITPILEANKEEGKV